MSVDDQDLSRDLIYLLRNGLISKEWAKHEKIRHQNMLESLETPAE
jgi:hypothetical protein